jgi:hypothetical protein
MADITSILKQLTDERDRINKAIDALTNLSGTGTTTAKKTPAKKASVTQTVSAPKKRKKLSAEARKRISEAQKKRWAESNKAKK